MLTALALTALIQTVPVVAQPEPFDPAARVREAIAVVRPVAYRSAHVDWDAMEADMLHYAEGAKDTADMLPAYQTLVFGLGDGHSFQQPTPEATAAWRERHGDRRLRPDLPPRHRSTSSFVGRTEVEHRDLPLNAAHDVRLVVTPQFSGGGPRGEAYADALFRAVAEASPRTCGYIIDLRGNGGGNFWPMVTGLSGLIGDSPQGLYRDAQGRDSTYAQLRNGRALIAEGDQAGTVMAQAPSWRELPALARAPVAVLVDDGTASSGEGVALAFVGRANTRSFGARTFGVASANNGFPLSDGTNLVITVAMMVDPTGQIHPEGYTPDELVDPTGETAVEVARAWLKTQAACGD